MRHSKEQQNLASDIVKCLNSDQLLSYEDIMGKVMLGKGLTSLLVKKLAEYNVVKVLKHKGKKFVFQAPSLFYCNEREKEVWVLGALHDDL